MAGINYMGVGFFHSKPKKRKARSGISRAAEKTRKPKKKKAKASRDRVRDDNLSPDKIARRKRM